MSGASGWQVFWWVVLPYIALAIFVVGHVWRWRYDQFGWRTFNPPLVENRLLRLGSPLVHLGVVAVIVGHLLGLLVPKGWTAALGVTDPVYRFIDPLKNIYRRTLENLLA